MLMTRATAPAISVDCDVGFSGSRIEWASPVVVAADELWSCSPSVALEPGHDRSWQFVARYGGAGNQGTVATSVAADHQDVTVGLAASAMMLLADPVAVEVQPDDSEVVAVG